MKLSAKHTVYGCYLGYITQAIVNNLPPLLFLTFHRDFGISLEKISLLCMAGYLITSLSPWPLLALAWWESSPV